MGFDRYQAKMRAKNSMRINKPSPLLVTLVFLLLTTLVSRVISLVMFNPTDTVLQYYSWGYELGEILEYIGEEYPRELAMVAAVNLILSVYTTVMNFGYTSYALRLARDESPAMSHIFDGFLKLWRVLWISILTDLFVACWMLVPMVLSFVCLILGNAAGSGLLIGLYLLLAVVSIVVGLSTTYWYRLAFYFVLDDPDCTGLRAIRRSKAAMKGWRMELFILDLSFFGWTLLSAFTWNCLDVWVMPYRRAAEANFYDCVTTPAENRGPELPPLG